jgi:hypothetical protein
MKSLATPAFVESTYPSRIIAPRIQFLLQEMFPPHSKEKNSRSHPEREGPGLGR